MAPELVREQPYNHTVDLWSLGVILYESFVGQPLFYTNSVPALIQHMEVRATTATARQSDFALRSDENSIQTPNGKENSPAASEPCNVPSPQSAAKKYSPNTVQGNSALHDEFPGFSNPNDVKQTVNGAQIIGQENEALALILLPIKNGQKDHKMLAEKLNLERGENGDQDILHSCQSLRILSNLVAGGALQSGGILDEIIWFESSDVNELVAKSFSVTKILLAENNGSDAATSYFKHWVVLVEIFSQGLRACSSTQVPKGIASPSLINESLKQILDHAVTSRLVDHLCLCLATSGASLSSGSTNMLLAACEACRAIWPLMDAHEIFFVKENPSLFHLDALRSHFLARLDIRDHARGWLAGTEAAKFVDAVTRAFVRSKSVQFAIVNCLHQRLFSRCCLHNGIILTVLCGLPNSLPVTTIVRGGADGTIVSELFSILSLCSSLNKNAQSEMKCKIMFKIYWNSAIFMLTTSPKKQLSRLTILAQLVSSKDTTITSLQPLSASAMLALASILSLEVPLIPPTSTLCDHLKISSDCENDVGPKNTKAVLSYWHGFRDGCVGLLESKLEWGGPLAVQQLIASGIPLLLINFLASNHSIASRQGVDSPNDGVGLSPIGLTTLIPAAQL
ncbi:hypothetical protein CXB51_004567 [Gossypium anomalum]|uniref:non-specific serine/threonine protein kinase n=1 Tax=Gossypium anomalum TaxID=47600 RepID=A0A8J6D816_9ROSI|nr:hypothetical protein CXB51_004567 [Gossypium anomalum]